ncbi:MAG TPA: hypothetical protein VN626_09050 [Clostridia bacterium]|nr:hypothetical protein [Clostridia bacterium]
MLKHRIGSVPAALLSLTACGIIKKQSAQVETSSSMSNRITSAGEAYLSAEDPLLRGAGTPAYWPPSYNQAGQGDSALNAYQVTEVTLVQVTYGIQQLYRLNDTDYLISKPDEENDNIKTAISNRANELIALKHENPQVRFYTYFITRATNCNWYSRTEGIFAYDYAAYFKSLLINSNITCGEFAISNLKDYMETGYKLDFHLNHIGSYRAYRDIYQMFTKDITMTPMKQPLREVDYDNLLTVGQTITDPVSADIPQTAMDIFKTYQFDYGSYTSYVDDKQVILGMEEEYSQGQINRDPTFQHLFSFYGGQSGVIRLEFDQPERPNLLMLSDSQGRPFRKLLASHFNRTIYLDPQQTNSVDINQVITENDIDVVLLVGQIGMFESYTGG